MKKKWHGLLVCALAILWTAVAGCQLAPQRAEGVYSFVTLGDNRSGVPIVQPQAYRDIIGQVNRLRPRPEFVVIVGDLILGYVDDRELAVQEWEEFDRVTATFEPPVYLVPGNHDIWDEESYALYKERYGPTYYSFDHGADHFIILSSEEPGEVNTIAGAQLEWLARDLEAHRDAEHTFVFLHRPLWGSHRGMAGSGWGENVHPLLARYGVEAVFAGHDHEFVNYGTRDGVQYYVTGGAGAPTSGIGGFHHFMVTTVAPEGVSSVVIDTEGNVLPDDVVTLEMKEAYMLMSQEVALQGFTLPEEGNRVELSKTVHNPFDSAVELRYEWQTEGTAWRVEPAAGSLTIAPGDEATMKLVVTFDRQRVMPVPELRCTVALEGEKIVDISTRLQPLVRRRTTAVRLERPPVIDGVIGEGEYDDAPVSGDFVDYRGRGYPEFDTRFMVAYDAKALYVAVVAEEPDKEAITVRPRERDGDIWRDDDIELFIDATHDRSTYHHFMVNLEGVQYDAIGGPEHGQFGDAAWDAQWDVAVKVGGAGYVVELAIPHEALGVAPPEPGDTWGLNLCRQRQAPTETWPEAMMAAWSIPYANFHVPTHFGDVTFE